MRAFFIVGCLALIAMPAIAAQENDAEKMRFVLMLLREDVPFTEGISSMLDEFVQKGRIPPNVSLEMKEVISPNDYLKALGAFYVTKLSPSEIDELLEYFRATANLALYRELVDAHTQFEGQALEHRRAELAARDPVAWAAAAKFSQSKALANFLRLRKETDPIKVKCWVDAISAAQKTVRERRNAGN